MPQRPTHEKLNVLRHRVSCMTFFDLSFKYLAVENFVSNSVKPVHSNVSEPAENEIIPQLIFEGGSICWWSSAAHFFHKNCLRRNHSTDMPSAFVIGVGKIEIKLFRTLMLQFHRVDIG